MATSLQRSHAAGLMRWLIGLEPQIAYVQRRPMASAGITEQTLADLFTARRHMSMDCSEAVTLICRLAGLADPNGLGYNGQGFTGTMLSHLPHYTDPKLANVAALVVFSHPGVPSGDHVAQVLTPGADPWLFSHGSTAGPRRIRLSTELAAQRSIHGTSTATFLNVSAL